MIKINKELLHEMINGGFVVETKHQSLDIYLYNYTRKCTYEKMWNEVTLICRGLILDKNKNIVALPLRKFFNYEEYGTEIIENELRGKKYHVYNKIDGSCGILWEFQGHYGIATRGSFESEQAIYATKLLNEKYINKVKELDTDKFTYVFEIVFPDNRIVVDYGNLSELIFLEESIKKLVLMKYLRIIYLN
ncbi:MAG TPA: RNA ligase [Bacteroidales bacterium]|nr:RNA ligase [Bacteroidales bacterium]